MLEGFGVGPGFLCTSVWVSGLLPSRVWGSVGVVSAGAGLVVLVVSGGIHRSVARFLPIGVGDLGVGGDSSLKKSMDRRERGVGPGFDELGSILKGVE